MILKYSILSVFLLVLFTSSDPFFGRDYFFEPSVKEISPEFSEISSSAILKDRSFLDDKKKLVSPAFQVTPFFYPNVMFWFLIYTRFDSDHVVIHDRSNLSLIYSVLDFSSLDNISKYAKSAIQQKISQEKVEGIKEKLKDLEINPFSLSPASKNIYKTLLTSGITIPLNKEDRIKFFRELRKNIRSQTGQKNYIRSGILRSLPYQSFLSRYFTDKNIPKELLGLPLLESSFNPVAHSRSSALGVWQFMPLTASHFVPPRTNLTDYRQNIGVSSLAAAFLISENYRILKSWDLAITAYNSGTKHLLKTKRELASDNVDLEAVITHSDSEHFGFASKNFFSEFVALAHVLAYQDEVFPDLHAHDRADVDQPLRFFITKCAINILKLGSKEMYDDIIFHNHHLPKKRLDLPRGFVLTTKSALPSKMFYEVSYQNLLRLRPKDWNKLTHNQSCSTR